MSTATPSPSLRSLFSELEQLFQTETEARVSTSVQAAERGLAEHLNQAVRRLRQASGFSEAAAVLCDASERFAKLCAVFHVHEETAGGERARGMNEEASARFPQLRFQVAEGAAFSSLLASRDPVVALATAGELTTAAKDALGTLPDDKVHLFPLTVERTTIGVLLASGAVESAALELLAQTASTVFEARQRPARVPLNSIPPEDLVQIAAGSAKAAPPAREWDDLNSAEKQLHLRAQRFARVEVAEIQLHRPDAVKAGRAQQNLYGVLQDAIDRGREGFRNQFLGITPTMADYFHLELINTLANGNPDWMGEEYPGRMA